MKTYEYTYKIKSINIHDNYILVEYMASDVSLTSYTYNLYAYAQNEDGTSKTIDEIIRMGAPHKQWELQEVLIEQYSELLNKKQLVTI
jgi:hypothetical protein